MNCYHTINNIPCPHSKLKLKGASASGTAVNNKQQYSDKKLVFNQNELSILSKVLEVCRYYITKNKDQFQSTENILQEINQSLQILKPGNSNQLKGASACNKKQDHLKDILKLFNLI